MDVFWQIVRDGAPLLTLLAILATLRGQRVINANAARERYSQARNEALMVILSPRVPSGGVYIGGALRWDPSVLSLVLEVTGTSPIVKVESVLVDPSPVDSSDKIVSDSPKTMSVMKAGAEESMQTITNAAGDDGYMWRVTWEDAHGYVWRNYYDLREGKTTGLVLFQSPAGGSPITDPRWWQRWRNGVLPYDNWAPRRES
ncbi:hypothetical protein WHI96_13140 [Pseudonocardia tropica]|uniref:Uncharacterized protein n=1 Tax=Pseudonocardia tropica TaxID=681289 RepID=A0ABV1JWL6_9PSEU